MRLLILTQKIDMNDDLLGFFHGWAMEFAKQCEKLTVIALGVGQYNLPGNVKVLSLGKEGKIHFAKKLKYLIRFYYHIIAERKNYDAVLVHMNKEYVILGGLIWWLLGKKIGLWYVHKHIDFKLRLAVKLADAVFTASPESFRLVSDKLKIIGHGVDLSKFNFASGTKNDGGDFKIIYVGRISKIKNQRFLIEAMNILDKRGIKNIKIDLVGGPIYPEDRIYQKELEGLIGSHHLQECVNFVGSVSNKDIARYYRGADLSINLCPTGGMDKAVLESMAAGVPVLVLNKTFVFLRDICENLVLREANAAELADKIFVLMNLTSAERAVLGQKLNDKVFNDYDLAKLIRKIINELSR